MNVLPLQPVFCLGLTLVCPVTKGEDTETVHIVGNVEHTTDHGVGSGTVFQASSSLPKREAFQFIIRNEHTPRRYYSGFMGMLNPDGDTHLYVSLRCMNIEGNQYHLYAGGGLLKDSVMEQEWQETEAKLQTMRRCLAIKKM